MAQIMLTASQLEGKIQEMTKFKKDYDQDVNDANQIVSQIKNGWEGDASDAFQAEFKQIYTKLQKAGMGLDSYLKALNKILAEYKSTESKNVNIAKSI